MKDSDLFDHRACTRVGQGLFPLLDIGQYSVDPALGGLQRALLDEHVSETIRSSVHGRGEIKY